MHNSLKIHVGLEQHFTTALAFQMLKNPYKGISLPLMGSNAVEDLLVSSVFLPPSLHVASCLTFSDVLGQLNP